MSIEISFVISDSRVPFGFTAWGTYSRGDSPTSGSCKMTNGGYVKNVPLSAGNFRPDGIWTATFVGLDLNTGYQLDAEYIPGGGGAPVCALPETNIEVVTLAAVVAPPAIGDGGSLPAPPAHPGGAAAMAAIGAAAAGVAAGGGAGGPPVVLSGSYPGFSGVRRVVAVVHEKVNKIAYASTTPGIARLGKWAVVVPRPSDLSLAKPYIVEVLLLNAEGEVVLDPVRISFPV
jgi:hypothetical protein